MSAMMRGTITALLRGEGDAITFLREKEGMAFMDAVRSLAEMRMDVPNTGPHDPEASARRDHALAILDDADGIFSQPLRRERQQGAILPHAADQQAIEMFRLGYAPRQG